MCAGRAPDTSGTLGAGIALQASIALKPCGTVCGTRDARGTYATGNALEAREPLSTTESREPLRALGTCNTANASNAGYACGSAFTCGALQATSTCCACGTSNALNTSYAVGAGKTLYANSTRSALCPCEPVSPG